MQASDRAGARCERPRECARGLQGGASGPSGRRAPSCALATGTTSQQASAREATRRGRGGSHHRADGLAQRDRAPGRACVRGPHLLEGRACWPGRAVRSLPTPPAVCVVLDRGEPLIMEITGHEWLHEWPAPPPGGEGAGAVAGGRAQPPQHLGRPQVLEPVEQLPEEVGRVLRDHDSSATMTIMLTTAQQRWPYCL